MKKTGDYGENLAASFLENKGYEILERNWRGVPGMRAPEIDIIACNKQLIAFVEVKTSSTSKFGSPGEWINKAKRDRLIEAAQVYLSLSTNEDLSFRFDAILIDNSIKPPEITHIENAFTLSD